MNCAIYTLGGHERGMGHIYQSRALAEELQKVGAQVQFIVPDLPEGVAKLRQWGMKVQEISHHMPDGEKISHIEKKLTGTVVDVVIVDMLESTPALMCYLGNRAQLLVSLDDIGGGRVWADLLINIIHHPVRPLGAHYREINDLNHVILHRQFCRAHQQPKMVPETACKILVSQGGSDTFGGIVKLSRYLQTLSKDLEIHLLVGPAFHHEGPLADVVAVGNPSFVVQRDVHDMAGLMQQMDLAITGGGKTLFELAAVGVPCIIVTEEPRELETAAIVARNVHCVNLGLRQEVSADRITQTVQRLIPDRSRRLSMSCSGKAAVDGRGAGRSVQQMLSVWQEKTGLTVGTTV